MVPCGTRRASVCPACADRYAGDAFHLIRAGLTGDDTKDVADTVVHAPRLFLTLTAPSFGPVHSRRLSKRGFVIPCGCGEKHREADTRIGGAIDRDTYDYEAAVLWQAHAGELWHRWCIAVRRGLAKAGGVSEKELRGMAVLSYAKVAEYQVRGMIHFHAIVRVDGSSGPGSTAPDWITPDLLSEVCQAAASSVVIETVRTTGEVLPLKFGDQVDPRPIASSADGEGESTAQLAGYIAKYATKSSGVTDSGIDSRVRSREQIEGLSISEHHRRMMLTAWDLGGFDTHARLNLRHWAHMLGFRGHFLTKSQKYSVTFRALRSARARHRFVELLDSLATSESEVTVINSWQMTGAGHSSDVERELAAAIGEGYRSQRKSRKE